MTYEGIIEREWRKALMDNENPVHVELDLDAEEIKVWYRCCVYTCDCDDDENFVFVRQDNGLNIVFPIPEDYYNRGEV
jgi:hypothetical protein